MSFFKKMMDKLDDVVGNDDKKKEEHHEGPHQGYGQDQQPHYNQQAQCGQPPSSYGHPQQAPPPHLGSSAGPQLPPGWISQWDQSSQRYYYLEQVTGRTQWDPPSHSSAFHGGPPPMAGPPMGGYGQAPLGGSAGYGGQQYNQYGGGEQRTLKEKSGKEGMLGGAAGGLAVGAVGGALLGHAMGDDSDDERKAYAQQQTPYGGQGYYPQDSALPLQAPPPGSNSSVSSSDKGDLQEAREDYENASASDKEEAREEYEEQYEETYGSD